VVMSLWRSLATGFALAGLRVVCAASAVVEGPVNTSVHLSMVTLAS